MTEYKKDNGEWSEVVSFTMDHERKTIKIVTEQGNSIKQHSISLPLAKEIGLLDLSKMNKVDK